MNKESTIALSYNLAGETLIRSGRYTSADVYVQNGFTDKEVFKINKPSRTIEPAVYDKAYTVVNLGVAFISMALEQPKKPEGVNFHRWLRTPLGQASQNWKRMTPEQRIAFHVELYVKDMGGEDYTYEIL